MNDRPTPRAPEGFEADAAFAVLFSGRRLDAIARERATVCGLWPDLTIALVNTAWWTFADENGAPPDFRNRFGLGASMGDGIAGPQRAFYEKALRRTLDTGRPWRHIYLCPSETLDRTFHLEAVAVGEGRGLLLTHVPHGVGPHPPGGEPAEIETRDYVDASGLLHQCGHCRRFRHARHPARWDWIPAWISAAPRAISHGLCRPCLELHYAEL